MINVEVTLNLTDDCVHWLNEQAELDGYEFIDQEIEDIIELICQKEYFTEDE